MTIPFSVAEFIQVFTDYNAAIWPGRSSDRRRRSHSASGKTSVCWSPRFSDLR